MEKTWFDRLLDLLNRMDTPRLLLIHDVVTALVARRLAEDAGHPTIEAAVVDAAEKQS